MLGYTDRTSVLSCGGSAKEYRMAKLWTDQEFAITDEEYQKSVEKILGGLQVSRSDVFRNCCDKMPSRKPTSISAHLGNLTTAREELGLPILKEIAPFRNRPEKLITFLKSKYSLN